MSRRCPCCGGELTWIREGEREKGFCRCNPHGPVIERDFLTEPWESLLVIPGVNREVAQALYAAGLCSVREIRAASDDELLAVSGIGKIRAAKIRGWLEN
jgi:ERCC4-type nuclease